MALVIDGDVNGPSCWQPMLTALAQKGPVVRKYIVAAPEHAAKKTWASAMEATGIEFVPVQRRVGGSKDPNDIAVALEAGRLVSMRQVDAVAIAVGDSDFLHVAQRWRALGNKLITLFPGESCRGLASQFARFGAEVVRYGAEDGNATMPKMKAVLHPTGESSVERISGADQAAFGGSLGCLDAIERKVLDLDYLAAPGAPLIPAIAKYYIANAIGPLIIWPPTLAFCQFEADVLQTAASRAPSKNPGDLVYVAPCSNGKGSKKYISMFGSLKASRALSAGGPFVMEDSARMPEDVLRRLGYLDDDYNKDLNEAIDTFASTTQNRRNFRELGIDIFSFRSLYSKKAALHTVLTSGKLHLNWQVAPNDSSIRQFFYSRGYISAADCSADEVWEGLKSYARKHDIPASKTYNALVRCVRETFHNNPTNRSERKP